MAFDHLSLVALFFIAVFVEPIVGLWKCNDCCVNYKNISEPRRSTESKWTAGYPALCDRTLTRGWYRFTSFVGGKMPMKMIPQNHCGTTAPVWLNGQHPSAAEGTVIRQACVNFFDIKNGCYEKFNINVTNCGGFFVYYLRPVYSCFVAYCAGHGEPCPYGKVGKPPNSCYDPPAQFSIGNLGKPTIEIKDAEEVEVALLCKVKVLNGVAEWKNVTYLIEWYSEEDNLTSSKYVACGGLPPGGTNRTPCPGKDQLVSTLTWDKYKIGQWISCKVSAKFSTSPNNSWSTPKHVQEPFFAGIKVYPTSLLLNVCDVGINQTNQINITANIPVRKNQNGHYINISFWLPDGVLEILGDCEVPLKGTKTVTVTVKTICGTNAAGANGVKLIIPRISNSNGVFWLRAWRSLPTVWVTVKNGISIETCSSVTDPHYRALHPDGKGRSFDFMGNGDFILYRNTERNFEVQTRQWVCVNSSWFATCNCGAVLRDHNDVIVFSICDKDLLVGSTTPIKVQIRSKKCLSPGISMKKKQMSKNIAYEVMFPSGARVNILRNTWGLDIFVDTPRASKAALEKGLCLYDGKTDATTFGNNLRLESGTSFFDTLPSHVNDSSVSFTRACSCFNPKRCEDGFQLAFPTVGGRPRTPMTFCDREKRDIHDTDELTDDDVELFRQAPPTFKQRFKRGLPFQPVTKENATRYCGERILDTEIGKLCAKVGVNLQALVNTCSADIVLSGDFSYATGAVAFLINQCGDLGARNMSIYSNGSSEGKPTVPSLEEEIAELLCPNDCNFNGKCVNSSCVCNETYTGEDCAVSIYEKPDISKLQSDGLCDRRRRPCKKVAVLGSGFLSSPNMTCHVEQFKVVDGHWAPNDTELKFPGIMTDLVLVDCYLPQSPVMQGYYDENIEGTPAAGLMISVSNDGAHRSNDKLKFISYDSACMNCSVSSGCFLKNDSCFINRYCFAPNETNPKDWCVQCLPNFDTKSWTKRKVNLPPLFSNIKQYYAVYQEKLELVIDVSDPEGMPITVSLMDGSPREAILRENVLLWNVTGNGTTSFYLNATDACQASSTQTITIDLLNCQCKNNGRCVPHPSKPRGSGFYECNCAPGFTGDVCETNIDDCKSYPCLRGRCDDMINNYTCYCDPGFIGRNCDGDFDDCKSSPCVHGNCSDFVGAYVCSCEAGYTGLNCTGDIDECLSSPCIKGICIDFVNNYSCQCQGGYTGYDCDTEIDECLSSPCVKGTCVDEINGFKCMCQPGFTGQRCQENINDCSPFPCGNGTCFDHVNNYSCKCNAGFKGLQCDVIIRHCSNDSCYPNVTCTESSNIISCGSCPPGLSGDGKNCEDINYCLNVTCENGGSCVDGINNYTCSCHIGFTGDHCETDIDDCLNRTCYNGASCVDGVNNYTCRCQAGFAGLQCETNIDDCVNRTCDNGGSCVDSVNSYSCVCQAGFTGDHCQTDVDDCVNHTCSNGSSCVDSINSYSCVCQAGFTGDRCQTDIDDCVDHTCTNGGSCVDQVNNYMCVCQAGFTGDHCESDIDNCVNHTCHNGGSCVDGVNNYTCLCQAGFAGDHCETDINDCVNRTCDNGGSCVDSINSYSCVCQAGFTGDHCQTDINYCLNVTCENGGSCVDEINGYTCSCQVGFTGDRCKIEIDDCHNVNCKNGGTCIDGVNEFTCTCKEGFTGKLCETEESIGPSTDKNDEETTVTATSQSTTKEKLSKEFIMEIRIKEKWNEDLRDKNSDAFNNVSSLLTKEIGKSYSGNGEFQAVKILSLSPGSIVAEFQLLFKTAVNEEEALAPLKKEVEDGKLGSLVVEPDSLKKKTNDEDSTPEKSTNVLMIIGISCGVFFLIAIVTVWCIRNRLKERVGSDGMPQEIAFPNPQKYEMEIVKREEKLVWMEERGLWNSGIEQPA